ncbi:dipeptidase PepV [Enterococcus dispar]|mgnify:CR=1 FL=1|jgi:dipeptidase PepV|uniref:Dipeptidase PepV n=3 Tax=Enterococcus TaxID=1350 RepID=S1NA86_9ENTE|nr:dipeptidase PepV [Enterococcus dispar]EOT38411.1 dipeptidase PepV [Enterococcus dispar ATCC 51266]EOW85902.1 dipeptidase PepV [Enterococcus dispar ATCC 51266]MDT2704942.1 dipeptidase PepV [Enterococcus dispar]OJG38504.1 dipeptidase PepV [Enterococcus dispar]WCG32591.1 dipeptidase PepV [Enterococcus dispar]
MEINWQKEVDARKDDLLKDLFDLLRINSERDDSKKTADAPFGPGPKDALKHMLAYGQRDGFTVKNVDNYAGHIEFGQGDETLGIFGHMDVVPAGDGWDTDPYEPELKDGKIFARGSSDDKGPSMAAYYGMKIVRDLGLPLSKKVRFVVGSDEESGWADMNYYFEKEEKPDFGFSPDAEFPIINGEKGNITLGAHFHGNNEGAYVLKNFAAGLRENMVPGAATAKVLVPDEAAALAMEKAFYDFVEKNPVTGTITVEDVEASIELVGKSAHGASPQSGINAGTFLALFLDQFKFGGGAKQFLHVAGTIIHEDFYGEKLGVAYEDEKMGNLTMNAGLFAFKANEEGFQADNFIAMNFRYPKGVTAEGLEISVDGKLGMEGASITHNERNMLPHYVPEDDPLVATLLAVYEDHTGEKGHEKIIGGGTYGRLLERGVAYGAMFPGYVDTMHQANEFMTLDDLLRATAIYADAIYRLAK